MVTLVIETVNISFFKKNGRPTIGPVLLLNTTNIPPISPEYVHYRSVPQRVLIPDLNPNI